MCCIKGGVSVGCGCVLVFALWWAFLPFHLGHSSRIDTEAVRNAARADTVHLIDHKLCISNVYVLACKERVIGGGFVQEFLVLESFDCASADWISDGWILLHIDKINGNWRRHIVSDALYGLGVSSYTSKPRICEVLRNRIFWSFDEDDKRSIEIMPSEWKSAFGRVPRRVDVYLERIRRCIGVGAD
jgi:hypothetical protein